MKQAHCIISEAGMQNLMSAGISTGWLRAWLLSAGATDVQIHLLESGSWKELYAEWQLFFATEPELNEIAESILQNISCAYIPLENPPRHACHFQIEDKQILLLPVGEIAYQRTQWLTALNGGKTLLPLYVSATDNLPIALEPGMSASIDKPESTPCLNSVGLTLEEQVINTLKEKEISIRAVESCTAGSIISRLCRVPGSSSVVDRSWVTYSNQAKQEEVDVDPELIEEFGAVSQDVVIAMALGGAAEQYACIAVSGIAGPGGGTEEKPVGTVWIAASIKGQGASSRNLQLDGARHEIQSKAVIQSLSLMLNKLEKQKAHD